MVFTSNQSNDLGAPEAGRDGPMRLFRRLVAFRVSRVVYAGASFAAPSWGAAASQATFAIFRIPCSPDRARLDEEVSCKSSRTSRQKVARKVPLREKVPSAVAQ
jgi:hypothetical protein